MPKEVTQKRLMELFEYDKDSGVFKRLVSNGGRWKVGSIAGTTLNSDYVKISVDGLIYVAHRLAWLYINGNMPRNDIDHINGDKRDNRLSNLRIATRSQNMQNCKHARINNKSSGLLGAYKNKKNWCSKITLDGNQYSLGTYKTTENAHAVYLAAKRKYHEYCTI